MTTPQPEPQIIDLAREGTLLPPAPGKCPGCAVDHEPEQPHDQQSLYFQYAFYGAEGRWPTWGDAMAHCDTATRELWTKELMARGVAADQF